MGVIFLLAGIGSIYLQLRYREMGGLGIPMGIFLILISLFWFV